MFEAVSPNEPDLSMFCVMEWDGTTGGWKSEAFTTIQNASEYFLGRIYSDNVPEGWLRLIEVKEVGPYRVLEEEDQEEPVPGSHDEM